MNSIFRKEYKHYFIGAVGWLTTTLLLLAAGLMTVLYGFVYGDRDVGYVLRAMQLPLILILPLISAGLWSRERRGGTDRLLFSLPVRTRQIVLGKYAAATLTFLLPTALLLVLPVIYSLYTEVAFLSAYSALLGYLLTGCATLAVGFLVSTFFRRAWVSYLVTVGVCLLLYLLPVVAVLFAWLPWLALSLAAVFALLVGLAVFLATRRLLVAVAFDGFALGALTTAYLISKDAFASAIDRVLVDTNPYEAMNAFSGGFFSLSGLLSLLAVIALCLLLTTLRLALFRREGGEGTLVLSFKIAPVYRKTAVLSCVTVLLILATACLPALAGLLPMSVTTPDVSGEETFHPDPTLLDQVAALSEPVTLTLLSEGGESTADRTLLYFLHLVAEKSEHVTVEVRDPETVERAAGARNLSILVESGKRYRLIDNAELYFYYDAYGGVKIAAENYSAYLNQLLSSTGADSETVQSYLATYLSARFDGSARLSSALTYVTAAEVPEVWVLVGEGASGMDSDLVALLYDAQYDLRALESVKALPDSCDLLYIHAPTTDLSDEDCAHLEGYLSSGGKLILSTHYGYLSDLPRLRSLLAAWGMSVPEDSTYLCEGDADYTLSTSLPYAILPHIGSANRLTGNFTGNAMIIMPHPITLTETAGVSLTPWLYTSPKGYYLKPEKEEEPAGPPGVSGTSPAASDESGESGESGTGGESTEGSATATRSEAAQYHFGVLAERGEGAILWIGAGDFLTTMADYYAGGGNFALALNAFDALTGHASLAVSVESAVINTAILDVTDGAFFLWIFIFLALPITTAILGTLRVKRRR